MASRYTLVPKQVLNALTLRKKPENIDEYVMEKAKSRLRTLGRRTKTKKNIAIKNREYQENLRRWIRTKKNLEKKPIDVRIVPTKQQLEKENLERNMQRGQIVNKGRTLRYNEDDHEHDMNFGYETPRRRGRRRERKRGGYGPPLAPLHFSPKHGPIPKEEEESDYEDVNEAFYESPEGEKSSPESTPSPVRRMRTPRIPYVPPVLNAHERTPRSNRTDLIISETADQLADHVTKNMKVYGDVVSDDGKIWNDRKSAETKTSVYEAAKAIVGKFLSRTMPSPPGYKKLMEVFQTDKKAQNIIKTAEEKLGDTDSHRMYSTTKGPGVVKKGAGMQGIYDRRDFSGSGEGISGSNVMMKGGGRRKKIVGPVRRGRLRERAQVFRPLRWRPPNR